MHTGRFEVLKVEEKGIYRETNQKIAFPGIKKWPFLALQDRRRDLDV